MSADRFAEHNRGVKAARDAYRADRLAEDGICTVCGVNKAAATRVCWTCRKQRQRIKRGDA